MIFKRFFLLFIAFSILGAVGNVEAASWRNPVLIAGEPDIKYEKPTVRFGPSGMVYIVYKFRDTPKGLTEIYLNTYDGEKVGILGDRINVSDSPSLTSYEPVMFATPNEFVHVAWCEYPKSDKENHYMVRDFYHRPDQDRFTRGYTNGSGQQRQCTRCTHGAV
jgi:hypothetical protein